MKRSESLQFYPALDGLRALAVTAVIAYHCRVPSLKGGFLGVDLFFSLSGFLITLILLNEFLRSGTIALKPFFIRRVRRLLPALVFLVLGFLLAAAVMNRPPFSRALIDAAVGLLNIANITRAFQLGAPKLLGHLWSLSLEVQFYILWAPFCLWVLKRWRSVQALQIGCLVIIACAVLVRVGILQAGIHGGHIYNGTFARLDAFALGGLVACFVAKSQTEQQGVPQSSTLRALFVLAPFLALGAYLWFVHSVGFSHWTRNPEVPLMASLPSLFLIFGALGGSPAFAQIFSFAPLRYTGQISYGLYLWHYPIIHMARFRGLGVYERFGTVFLLTFFCAVISYHFVEKPFLKPRKSHPKAPSLPVQTEAPRARAVGDID